jgi:GxxExxY protein
VRKEKRRIEMDRIMEKDLCYEVLNCAFHVHSKLGPGLLEVLYKRALAMELKSRRLMII